MEMKRSRYTATVRQPDGSLVLYNTLTGAMVAIPGDSAVGFAPYLSSRPVQFATPTPEAELLLEGGFCIPSSVDERIRVSSGYRERSDPRSQNLIILPTEDCNFRCTYCYERFPTGSMKPWVVEAIKLWVSKEVRHWDSLLVDWFGGEPLLGSEIIEDLSHHFIERCQAFGTKYSARIVTNGYLLTQDVSRMLLANSVRTIQITLDGLPDDHNRLKPLRGGGDTFQTVWQNAKQLLQLDEDFSLSIRVNYDPQSIEAMPSFLDRLASLSANDRRVTVFFRPVGRWGGPHDEMIDVCNDSQATSRALNAQALDKGMRISDATNWLRLHGLVCYAADPHSIAIGADGVLHKCTVALYDERNAVGKMRPDGQMEMDWDRFYMWTTSDGLTDAKCRTCFFEPACQGAACVWKRIEKDQRPCPPAQLDLKQLLTIALRTYSNEQVCDGAHLASGDGKEVSTSD